MVNIGVIGCGHWGPNHIRVFNSLSDANVKTIADLDDARLSMVGENFPGITQTKNHLDIVNDSEIEAVVVVTPTKTHYKIVKQCLEAGKHVFCEKPLCVDTNEGEELVKLAESKCLTLMVGHIFLFNAGILKLKSLMEENVLGDIHYLKAVRTNLGPVRQDVNSVYDLATHDISIFNFLMGSLPTEVSAMGTSVLKEGNEDLAFISLKYPNNVLANIHVSWLDPKKVREITVVGNEKMVTWDDLGELGPITIYDKGVVKQEYVHDYGEFQLLAREGDITIPKVKRAEPLKNQDQFFLDCIRNKADCHSDGKVGNDIVKVLQAIDKSMAGNGVPVSIA